MRKLIDIKKRERVGSGSYTATALFEDGTSMPVTLTPNEYDEHKAYEAIIKLVGPCLFKEIEKYIDEIGSCKYSEGYDEASNHLDY